MSCWFTKRKRSVSEDKFFGADKFHVFIIAQTKRVFLASIHQHQFKRKKLYSNTIQTRFKYILPRLPAAAPNINPLPEHRASKSTLILSAPLSRQNKTAAIPARIKTELIPIPHVFGFNHFPRVF